MNERPDAAHNRATLITFNDTMPRMTIEVDGKPLVVILAPAPRMEFRDLTEDMLKPGMTLSVVGYRSKERPSEFRAQASR